MGIFVISFVILSPFHSTWLLCWHPCFFHRPSSHSLLLHQNKNWAVFFHHKAIAAILSGYGHKFLRVSNSLDLKMGLFICYVREYFIVKQITTKMYQVASEERFLFWAVCNIQLQVNLCVLSFCLLTICMVPNILTSVAQMQQQLRTTR